MPTTIACPKCGRALAPHTVFCTKCHHPIKEQPKFPHYVIGAFLACAVAVFVWTILSGGGRVQSASGQTFTGRAVQDLTEGASAGAAPVFDVGMSVEEAYAAIPHRRTQFDFASTSLSGPERAYLERAFALIDQSIALRVEALRKFSRADEDAARLIEEMGRALDYLQRLTPPARLRGYHQSLTRALTDQRAFYQEWSEQGAQFSYGRPSTLHTHPKVQSSSSALREAYGLLMQNYSDESQQNKQAFFDYHCALDFI